MKKKQDDETKVYLVYDEELDQFVLKKGDERITKRVQIHDLVMCLDSFY